MHKARQMHRALGQADAPCTRPGCAAFTANTRLFSFAGGRFRAERNPPVILLPSLAFLEDPRSECGPKSSGGIPLDRFADTAVHLLQ